MYKKIQSFGFLGFSNFCEFLFGESYKITRTRQLKRRVYRARGKYKAYMNKKYPGDGKDISIAQRYYGSRTY